MTTPPIPQPSSAEELAREIMCHFVVSLDQSVKTKERLALILTPLFTRLQESERVLGECVEQMDVMYNDGMGRECFPTGLDDRPSLCFREFEAAFKLATTHLNK